MSYYTPWNETVPLADDQCRRLAQGQRFFHIKGVKHQNHNLRPSPMPPSRIHRRYNSAIRTEYVNGHPCSRYR